MMSTTLIGAAAACCTTLAFVPQVVKSWQTCDLSGISLPMYSIFTSGVVLWLLYGCLIGDWPVIIANAVTAVLAGTVLCLKIAAVCRSATPVAQKPPTP